MSNHDPEISVIIPCLNEEENAPLIYAAVREELCKHAASFEIIFIDNCSTDGTRDVLRAICEKDPDVRGLDHLPKRRPKRPFLGLASRSASS